MKFAEEAGEIFGIVWKQLQDERKQLGGDIFALTFFALSYLTYKLVANAALDLPTEDEITLVTVALVDLDIHGEEEQLHDIIALETQWIKT